MLILINMLVRCKKFLLCEVIKIIFKTWINKINSINIIKIVKLKMNACMDR